LRSRAVGADADRRLPVFLRLRSLQGAVETQAGALLRVLLLRILRIDSLSASSG